MPRNEAKITLTAEDQATAVLRRARAEIDKLQPATDKLREIGSALGLLGGAGIGLSIAGTVGFVRQMVNVLDDLDEASQAAGVSAIALAELRQGAVQAGVGAERLDTAITKLNVKLAEAAGGDAKARAIFDALGVSAVDAAGNVRATDQVLADIATKFAGYANGAEKSALAVQLFGKAGAALVPYLNQGADGLRVFSGLTEETVRQAALLQSEFDKLAASFKRFGYEIAGAVIPQVNRMIEEFQAAQRAAGGFWAAFTVLPAPGSGVLDEPYKAIQKLEAELLKVKIAVPPGGISGLLFGDQQSEINAQRASYLERQIAFLKEIQRLRALSSAGPIQDELRFRAPSLPSAPVVRDPIKPATDKSRAEQITAEARAVEAFVKLLERESEQLDKITLQEQALKLLRDYPAIDTPALREALLAEAQRVEAAQEKRRIEEAVGKAIGDQARQEAQLRDTVLELAGVHEENRKRVLAEQLEILIQQGALTDEQAERAVKGIAGIRDEIDKTKDSGEEFALVLNSAVSKLIVDGGSGRDFFAALAKDVEQLIVKLLILEPLAEQIKAIFKSDGKQSVLESIASALGGLFGGGAPSAGTTGDFARIDRLSGRAAGGPVYGGHSYLVGERGPEVLTLGRSASGLVSPGGGVKVEINNYGDNSVSTRQRKDDNGGMTLEVMIERVDAAIAGRVASRRGSTFGAMQSTFGLRPAAR